MIHLLWAVHNHQPVGNFDFVFERAFTRAYRPFLRVLQAHPRVRLSMHCSGILLDWLEALHPEHLRDLRRLCEAGQVEMLGGGYYEPILPMLTEADRLGQIRALSRRVEELFGARPRGMWLAERVWEPSLVTAIADAGIEYVVLDGSHFKMVGRTEADLDGHFETEDQGRSLKLLPIHDGIRDTIPFRPVEDVLARLRALDASALRQAQGGPSSAGTTAPRVQVVFGDDGEKFGDWPETFDTVYTEGWLDAFFTALEAEPETFAVRPLREGVDEGRCLGLVYLPPASYQEMMAWAQNPADVPRYREVRRLLWDAGRGEDADRFVRGTFWRNFLVKYPESNRMHKQALRLSRALERAGNGAGAGAARNHVWQAQCNCAYWHGVFGGLYLPHLRFAIYRHLIAAQKLLDARTEAPPADWERTDWNFDGRAEHLLNTREVLIGFTADGAVDQLWLKRTGINLCDTLTRRWEPYHARIGTGSEGGTKLEDQIHAKEAGLEAYLVYDRRVRETCSEWVLPAGTPFADYRAQAFGPEAAFSFGPPVHRRAGRTGAEVRFEGTAPWGGGRLDLIKTFRLDDGGSGLEVRWKLRARGGAGRLRLAAETLFCLLAGDAPDRYVIWEENGAAPDGEAARAGRDILASRGVMPGSARVRLVDEWLGFRATVTAPGRAPAEVWRDAIETVSQSEGGYERVYQGTAIAPVWDLELADGGEAECGLRMEFEEGEAHGQQSA